MKKTGIIYISLIILLAAFLRFYNLTEYPAGFHIDEVTLGYNAYSLLKTGRDETGRLWPLYSQSFSLDRPLGNFLLVATSIAVLGLNELAVRLPFALFGVLTVLTFYSLVVEVSGNPKLGALSALGLAVSAWQLDIVRASSEASVSLCLILLSQLLFLRGLRKELIKLIIFSILPALLALFYYHAGLVFSGLSILFLSFYAWFTSKPQIKKCVGFCLILFFICWSVFIVLGRGGTNRLDQVGLHKDTRVVNEQNKMFYEEGQNNVFTARLFHNKLVTFTRAFVRNYFAYFSVPYLFLDAGLPPRYTPPAMGLMYLYELPLVLYGGYLILKSANARLKLMLGLLLLSPVAAAVTSEYSPNVQRAFFMSPYLVFVTSYALFNFWQTIVNHPAIKIVCLFLLSLNIFYYLHQYYIHLAVHDPLFRNDGARELVNQVEKLKDNYTLVVITTHPEPPYHYFLFYNNFPPQKFQEKYVSVKNDSRGWLFEDKIYFSRTNCPSQDAEYKKAIKYLYVDDGQCNLDDNFIKQFKIVSNILRKDGSLVYRIVEKRQ